MDSIVYNASSRLFNRMLELTPNRAQAADAYFAAVKRAEQKLKYAAEAAAALRRKPSAAEEAAKKAEVERAALAWIAKVRPDCFYKLYHFFPSFSPGRESGLWSNHWKPLCKSPSC